MKTKQQIKNYLEENTNLTKDEIERKTDEVIYENQVNGNIKVKFRDY